MYTFDPILIVQGVHVMIGLTKCNLLSVQVVEFYQRNGTLLY